MIKGGPIATETAARFASLEERVQALEVQELYALLERMRPSTKNPPEGDSLHDPCLSKEDLDQKLDDMVEARNEWLEKKGKLARQAALLRLPSHSRRVRSHYSEPLLRTWMEAASHPDHCPVTPSCAPLHCRHLLVDIGLTRKPSLVWPHKRYRAYLESRETQALQPCFVCLLAQTDRVASMIAYVESRSCSSALIFENRPLCRACESACFHDLDTYDFIPSEKQIFVVLYRPYVRYCD